MVLVVGGSSLRWIGTAVGCRTDGSGGQAPALHFPSPPIWISSSAGVSVLHVKDSRLAGGFPIPGGFETRLYGEGGNLRVFSSVDRDCGWLPD